MSELPLPEFQWTLRGRCLKLGHDVPHADGIIPARFITARETDPEVLVPHLFETLAPGFSRDCRPGDIVVTGHRFGMGPKVPGYIAMRALGLGLVCESMPVQAYRAAIGEGLRVLSPCAGALALCETGDTLEVDYAKGCFTNLTRDESTHFPPLPVELQAIVATGGSVGWLTHWWQTEGKALARPI